MTEREKQIAEMAEILDNQLCGNYEDAATALYDAGYRKIGENEIVVDEAFIGENFISKKALIAGQSCSSAIKALLTAEKVICEAKQETAKEIFEIAYFKYFCNKVMPENAFAKFINEMKERYEFVIEVEE